MLSQNRARVLGFSWLRRCLNQRWMVRTSQSSCLDRPSNLFSSGCWQDKIQNNPLIRCAGFHCGGTNVLRWRDRNMHHLGYSSENFLQDGVGLCFLWPVGLDLQAHGTWSGNKPAIKISWHPSRSRQRQFIFEVKEKYIGTQAIQSPGGVVSIWTHVSDCPLFFFYSSRTWHITVILRILASFCRIKEEVGTAQQGEINCFSLFDTRHLLLWTTVQSLKRTVCTCIFTFVKTQFRATFNKQTALGIILMSGKQTEFP